MAACDCIKITHQTYESPLVTEEVQSSGIYNGYNYWEFVIGLVTYTIWYDGSGDWIVSTGGVGSTGTSVTALKSGDECPFASMPEWLTGPVFTTFTTEECEGACVFKEDRTAFTFAAVKIPEPFVSPDRGIKDCCCEHLVLAKSTKNSWENDITSAWVKLSDPNDTVTFELYKDGQLTNYEPMPIQFVKDPNAYYTTIDWSDVLDSDGVGCYRLIVNYDIAGLTGQMIWGQYKLQPFTTQNALQTARVRAIFSGYHEADGIDFTDTNVESTHRFYGFIGNRQPNTQIDNLIYQNREMKRVIRENLNEYEIITDPSDECTIKPLVDLYLLSENQLFISDYNAHNHSYRYNDVPVIVQDSPELEYKEFSRKAVLRCVVGDKVKNQRTYYNG